MGTITKIGQIGVPAKDIERATAFYKDQLGLQLLFNTDTMAFFDCDGVRLLVSLPEKEEFAHASSVLYFHVENIQQAYENYREKGVVFIDEPHMVAKIGQTETWMVFFRDTEDNMHGLMSEVVVG
ncbi:VOC family protein [Sporosarcina thermotolerans]|uniref:VOC family protein n=1 Tax=Sporosarcina thermotolerans TaxID=633404 RepID=A0AAW9A6K2_9BACL|nr:VOC family protein [Sporosarcina thermotolerans]MDW0116570.1 VOC family protein [Sporosarcina thermotolerans]WHT48793.1 VOC family protein [Sporosarcina thermotolerans]